MPFEKQKGGIQGAGELALADQAKEAEIEMIFEVAKSDFAAERFDIAIDGFDDLAGRFPDSPQGREAGYWIAECRLAKKDFDGAEQAYILYIRQYPQGARICASLYKLGLIYDHFKKPKSRDLVWKKLIDQYPESQEAALARTHKG